MRKPVIAVTARNQSEKKDNPTCSDNRSYIDYVYAAGGIPVIVHINNEEEAQQIASQFDGLLITGGDDCNPAHYHRENTHSEVIDDDIEESDFLLYHAFTSTHKPVIGICRGIQVIAVCEGTELIQDLPSMRNVHHAQNEIVPPLPRNAYSHKVNTVKGTVLNRCLGDNHDVNSYHHQALSAVPQGFVLSAMSEDGIIEGIEKDHVIGVQWHPERLMHDPSHMAIMETFIKDCLSC